MAKPLIMVVDRVERCCESSKRPQPQDGVTAGAGIPIPMCRNRRSAALIKLGTQKLTNYFVSQSLRGRRGRPCNIAPSVKRWANRAMVEMIERCIIGQMLPILSFGEQFPTSIRMTRGCLTAQHCHRAQATRSIHVLLPLFLLMTAYFSFLRWSHYDYEAELIFIPEERFDFVAPSDRVSRTTGAISKGCRSTRFPVDLRALRIHRPWHLLLIVFVTIKFSDEGS